MPWELGLSPCLLQVSRCDPLHVGRWLAVGWTIWHTAASAGSAPLRWASSGCCGASRGWPGMCCTISMVDGVCVSGILVRQPHSCSDPRNDGLGCNNIAAEATRVLACLLFKPVAVQRAVSHAPSCTFLFYPQSSSAPLCSRHQGVLRFWVFCV